jgi:hypothetical protein
MVHGRPGLRLFVPGEHRKLDDPRKVHRLRIVELEFYAELLAEPVEGLAGDFELISDEDDEVARLRAEARGEFGELFRLELLGDRRGQHAAGFDMNGQPLQPKSCSVR